MKNHVFDFKAHVRDIFLDYAELAITAHVFLKIFLLFVHILLTVYRLVHDAACICHRTACGARLRDLSLGLEFESGGSARYHADLEDGDTK